MAVDMSQICVLIATYMNTKYNVITVMDMAKLGKRDKYNIMNDYILCY